MSTHRRLLQVLAATALLLCPAVAQAEPRVSLRFPSLGGASFANYAAVAVPARVDGALEIWIEDALGEIEVSTIRVRLNEMPMTPFVAINPLPRGARVIVRPGATLHPDFQLKAGAENLLTLDAQDTTKVGYQARFYLSVDPAATDVKELPSKAPASARTVRPPEQVYPPVVTLTGDWPSQTTQETLVLSAVITDREGLRRVVIEVDGRDVEEVLLQNEQPVRKRNGFVPRSKLPGDVSGDSRKLLIEIPVRLKRGICVVAVRAENASGLRARADRLVELKR